MFRTRNVKMQLAKASLRIVKDDKGDEHRMAECGLVLDPFTGELAHELGLDVYSHLFNEDTEIRPELGRIVMNPRVPQQLAEIRTAPDLKQPTFTVRYVDVLALGVNREEDPEVGDVWLRATVKVRFDLADKPHRELLAAHFGDLLCFTFQLEQSPLPFSKEK